MSVNPDVLAISGDLVEHATEPEFQAASDYINTLPKPQIVIPGNHDLAFYNLWHRLTQGLSLFRKYITPETSPAFIDSEIAVIGADSAHLYPVKGGKITEQQLDALVAQFSALPSTLIRILVTHHPFDLPEPETAHLLIGHARHAVTRLAPVVDILVAGHVHRSSVGSTSVRYQIAEHAMVFVQAGTAVSHRNKGEANSFNVIEASVSPEGAKQIAVNRFAWDQSLAQYRCAQRSHFRVEAQGWTAFD